MKEIEFLERTGESIESWCDKYAVPDYDLSIPLGVRLDLQSAALLIRSLKAEREGLANEIARLREGLGDIKEFHEEIDLNASQSPVWNIADKALKSIHGDSDES